MKRTKKIFAFVMALCLALSTFTIAAFADDSNYVEYNGKKYSTLADAEKQVGKDNPEEVVYTVYGVVEMINPTFFGGANTNKVTFNAGNNEAALKSVGSDNNTFNQSENPECIFDFNGIEILWGVDGNVNAWEWNSTHFAGKITFNNCIFKQGILINEVGNGTFVTFNNCNFDNSDFRSKYSAWISTGIVKFDGCTFSGTRGIKISNYYGENDGTNLDVSVTNCKSNLIDGTKPLVLLSETFDNASLTLKGNTSSATGLLLFEKKLDNGKPLSANVTIYLKNGELANVIGISEDEELNGNWATDNASIATVKLDSIEKPNDCEIAGVSDGKTLVTYTCGDDVAKFNIVAEGFELEDNNVVVDDETPLASAPEIKTPEVETPAATVSVSDSTPLAVANTADSTPIAATVALISSSLFACYAVAKKKNELDK